MGAIQVELTGGGFPLVEVLGPAAIIVAAVFGAMFAARQANRRQGRQLDAESERLGMQLDAENVRLREQLAHDREMRERDEIKTTVTDVMEHAYLIRDLGSKHVAQVTTFEVTMKQVADLERDGKDEEAAGTRESMLEINIPSLNSETYSALVGALTKGHSNGERLSVRLGLEHPIVTSYEKWLVDFKSSMDLYKLDDGVGPTGEEAAERTRRGAVQAVQFGTFLGAVQAWFGDRPRT